MLAAHNTSDSGPYTASNIGSPIPKSLVWVQKMAKMEGREKDLGLLMMNSIPPTRMKMRVLETKMARRKLHLILLKLSFARDVKIRTGRENLPTNVFRPFASVGGMIL